MRKYLKSFIAVIVMLLLVIIPTAHVFANEEDGAKDETSFLSEKGVRIGVEEKEFPEVRCLGTFDVSEKGI